MQIQEYERLTLGELAHRLGEISTDDLTSTQNALMILVALVQDRAPALTVLTAEVEHLKNDQEAREHKELKESVRLWRKE